jgi:hypothetical protein
MTRREAAQQALEALEAGPDVDPIFAGETIDALKTALEQEQEPVAWVTSLIWYEQQSEQVKKLTRVAQPENGFTVPLHARPPRREWVGLTEEEIQSLHDYYVKRLGPVEFACAIEAALKEKNK